MYKKLRNFRTVPPGITNLVSKCARNSKEKRLKVSRRELCALQSNRAKCRGGGLKGPPPSLFRVNSPVTYDIIMYSHSVGFEETQFSRVKLVALFFFYKWINKVDFKNPCTLKSNQNAWYCNDTLKKFNGSLQDLPEISGDTNNAVSHTVNIPFHNIQVSGSHELHMLKDRE